MRTRVGSAEARGSDHRQARSIIEAPICEISGRAQLNFITSFYRASRMALVWVSPLTASRAFFYRYVKLFARSPFTLKLILVIVFFQFFRFLTFCIWYCFILRIETAWRGVKKWVFFPSKELSAHYVVVKRGVSGRRLRRTELITKWNPVLCGRNF